MLRFWLRKIFTAELGQLGMLESVFPADSFEGLVKPCAGSLRLLSIAVVAAAFSAECHAQNNCPWLNVTTASGALGGASSVMVNRTTEGSGTCVFRLQSESPAENLTVSVTLVANPRNAEQEIKTSESRCTSSTTPLKALGNDAVLCANNTATSRGEQVIGRVRDQVFTISMITEAAPSHDTANDAIAEKLRVIAEQVAGNLF